MILQYTIFHDLLMYVVGVSDGIERDFSIIREDRPLSDIKFRFFDDFLRNLFTRLIEQISRVSAESQS